MKKRILILMVGFLFVGINVFAADGDLVVNGNATVNGNLTVQGINLTHVTGTNATCPSGTGGFLMRKLNARTCTDINNRTCTLPAGWGTNFTCLIVVSGEYGVISTGCPGTDCTCSEESWTEAVCMGN
jgi:hypothetical protein